MLNRELLLLFCSFLDKQLGLYFPKDQWVYLEKKLEHLKLSFGFQDTAACLEWLMKSPLDRAKLDILTQHLTIGETYFFRDSQLYAHLKKEIIPEIISRHQKDKTIKIWSAGCCTGEEPYSIAMIIHTLLADIKEWNITILGTDINSAFLKKAENACYKKWSFRTTSPNMQKRYFKKSADETYHLIPEIRSMVKFRLLNLVSGFYPDASSGIYDMDLIFCQNVLIYFSETQIKNTIHKFTNTLSHEGWLSLTAIEAPFVEEASLKSHTFSGAVFFKKEHSNKEHLLSPHFSSHSPPRTDRSFMEKANQEETLVDKCLNYYHKNAYYEVITLLEPYLSSLQNEPSGLKNNINALILLIRSYANKGDLSHALEWSEKALKIDNLNHLLHYLHATLLQDQGKIPEAIKFLKNVIFIDPHFMMAYLVLAILEKEQGNKKAALLNFKTSLELFDHHQLHNRLLIKEEYNNEYLRDLISNNIENLSRDYNENSTSW